MTDIDLKKLVDLVAENKTVNEISTEMGVPLKNLYQYFTFLKNEGMEFKRLYYSNGDISYKLKKGLALKEQLPKEQVIITKPEELELKILLLSDLHIGSIFERLDLIEKAYEYAIHEDIHSVIVAGDLVDGINIGHPKKHTTHKEQIDYFLDNYPLDKNILTYALLGDHDFDSLKNAGLDIEKIIESYRHDIVSLGYRQGILRIKNDEIFVSHNLEENVGFEPINLNRIKKECLVLEGHTHFMSLQEGSGFKKVHLPSLSNLYTSINPHVQPGMVKMTIEFTKNNGCISNVIFEQFLVDPEIVKMNEFNISLWRGRNTKTTEIENEVEPSKVLKK